jgi:ribosomal protein S18 acetylase RimI-like enzyme
VRAWPTDDVVALYEAGGWWRESPSARAAVPALVAGSFVFLVAVEDGRAVGMGRALSDGVSDAYLQDVVVLPSHRGRGIGGELIRRLTAHARARGLEWIGLVAEPGTTAFYARLGFRPLEGYVPMRLPPAGPP